MGQAPGQVAAQVSHGPPSDPRRQLLSVWSRAHAREVHEDPSSSFRAEFTAGVWAGSFAGAQNGNARGVKSDSQATRGHHRGQCGRMAETA